MRLLLVDDDGESRQSLADFLRDREFEVLDFTDGEAALEFVERSESSPDLLITEIDLPGINGLQLTQRMATQLSAPVPVIFLSRDMEWQWRVDELPGHFLAKPFSVDRLVTLLRDLQPKEGGETKFQMDS